MRNVLTIAAPTAVPPASGWVLRVQRRMYAGGVAYDRGCSIEPSALGKNYSELLSNGYIKWQPPGQASPVAPRKLETSEPKVEDRSQVQVLRLDDPVESWRASIAGTMEACNVNETVAKDLLMADRLGAELYRQAVRADAEREAIAKKTFGRRPVRAL